jgi:hypothetical protein
MPKNVPWSFYGRRAELQQMQRILEPNKSSLTLRFLTLFAPAKSIRIVRGAQHAIILQ